MESLGNLQLNHQPFHLSLTHTSSSFLKTPTSFTFRPLSRPISSFKCAAIKASSSKFQDSIIPLQQSTPFRLFKSTCITLTTAAALLFLNLQLKYPAIAAPVASPPASVEKEEYVSFEEERAIEEHLTTHPSDVDALRSLMKVRIKSRKLIEAKEVIDRLIELQPEDLELPVLKANIFIYSGDLDSAKTGFEEILAKDPLNLEAYNGLLMVYSDSGLDFKELEIRIEKAISRCKKEKKDDNTIRDFKLLVAQIRMIEGKYSEALKLYQELEKEEPSDFRPYLCQGIIYKLLKKKDKAEEQFEKFRKLVPKNHPYRKYVMDNMIAAKLFSEKVQHEMAGSES